MKSHSYNRAAAVRFLLVAGTLFITLWPATGQGQTSSRRERLRRDGAARSGLSRTREASRQASEQKAQQPNPVEPNVAGTRPVEAARPVERSRVEGSDMDATYEIILNRNIFSRQRTAFRPQDRNAERQVVVPDPETHFFLKGIVQENDQFIAFVEDTQGGGVLRLRQGDRVARGRIKALNLDALEYEMEGKTVNVQLGCDLEGARRTTTAVDLFSLSQTPSLTSTTAAGQQAPSQQQTSAPSPDEAEILKRLMEQRRQQLGQ